MELLFLADYFPELQFTIKFVNYNVSTKVKVRK